MEVLVGEYKEVGGGCLGEEVGVNGGGRGRMGELHCRLLEPSEDTSHIIRTKTTEAEVVRITPHSSSAQGKSIDRVCVS